MHVIISGSSGFVGSALIPFLSSNGHKVCRLVRRKAETEHEIQWDPASGFIEESKLEGVDAVVHLAGENISAHRWNAEVKARIRDSRLSGTRLLAETILQLNAVPKVFICASASGYYGDRGAEVLREESGPGKGFLADLCVEWEAAAQLAAAKGIRVVNLRFGIILSPGGGALPRMVMPFRFGAGGRIGSGRQYYSWITIDDVTSVIQHAMLTESLIGPVNTDTPNPVTNSEFTKALGKVLKRPTIFPLPAPAARIALGEMADELLLASARMEPAKLIAGGFLFAYPEIEGALYHLLR